MPALICSITPFSCALACIESILADNGVKTTQQEMLNCLGKFFPEWQAQPGGVSAAKFEMVFAKLGFPVTKIVATTKAEITAEMASAETVGAILCTFKYWTDSTKQALKNHDHATRLICASPNGVIIMDPQICPDPGILMHLSWDELQAFEGRVCAFRKK
jgi:hypothetical protein